MPPTPPIHRAVCLLALVLALSTVPTFAADTGFTPVTGPCRLQFPEDHGPHPGYKTEWWYYTGNVRADTGERLGFQLTFFHRRFNPAGLPKTHPGPVSAWRTHEIHLAHAAVSLLDGRRHLFAERTSRPVLGMAGTRVSADRVRVFLLDWSSDIRPDRHLLQVKTDAFSIHLALRPAKPPVAHGDSGYIQKGSSPESAGCYYSLTRLETKGTITVENTPFTVEGSSWMDHEYGSAPLEPGIAGWDWFSLQLDNGTELMIYLMRQKDGTWHPVSNGTYVDGKGAGRRVPGKDVAVTVHRTWKSPHSRAVYPVSWRLTVAPLALDLMITANLADQEMRTSKSTGVTYWEGSVTASGTSAGHPVQGMGYVELTGYAKPFDAPM